MSRDPGACTERELVERALLCTRDGDLNPEALGWSRRPLLEPNLSRHRGRKKRWDYWCITSPEVVLAITFADLDYVAFASVWCLDRSTHGSVERSAILPFGGARVPLGKGPADANGSLAHRGLEISLRPDSGDATRIAARCRDRRKSVQPFLTADIVVDRPHAHETLNVVIPWSESRFQLTSKQTALKARGNVVWNDRTYDLADGAFACLDYGRGVWPYRTLWNWASAAGDTGGRTIGLQLGGKWTDATGATENALLIDGRLHKLSEDLVWEYDTSDFEKPWRIRTPVSKRLDVELVPAYDRVSHLDAGLIATDVHQCFGDFAGTIVADDGEKIRIDGLFGWAEQARWRW